MALAVDPALYHAPELAAVPNLPPSASELQAFLDGEHGALKAELRALLSQPDFACRYDLDRTEHREHTWRRFRELALRGYGSEVFPDAEGRSDVPRFLAVFSTLGGFDPNLMVKFGLHFGLFGGAIVCLGTQRHHERYLSRASSLEVVGCYAMTEVGHGSDTRRLETIARYDAASDEFVIHTPSRTARKQFIGNAAMHANTAIVFAQLEVGEKRPGVFGFVVPIRNADGRPERGVRLGDTGPKAGLNGVDNGWLCFDHVRVPRENLLDRFGTVTQSGEYVSEVPNPTEMVQRAMSGGRIAIAGGSLSATKSGLTIAIRYAERRRQFGGKQEKLLLDYPLHQRRLLPRLATAYALDAALADLARASQETSALTNPEFDELTALLKAFTSWNAVDTLQTCREACGGQGYLAQNRIGVLRADIDPMTTLEGDNSLLYMFSAKVQLEALRDSTAGKRSAVLLHGARSLGERTAVALALRGAPEARLRDAAWLARLFRARERGALWDAARSFASRREAGADYQSPLLELAEARAERIVLEAFSHRLENSPASLRDTLSALRDLYACSVAHRRAAWYLSHHVLTAADVRRIESRIASLCHELRPRAVELVDGFGLPDAWLGDLIAEQEVTEPVL